MSGARSNNVTRAALVIVGLVLVSLGVLATLRFASGAGAAALVAGGLVVGLAGVAGSTFLRAAAAPSTSPEIHVSGVAEAQNAGDTEGALDRFAQALRHYAPNNAKYHEAATQAMYQAAGRTGEQLRPLYGFLLSPLAMSGSLVLVDIRGGTGLSVTRMQTTYQTLLVGPPPVFDGVLVVINAANDHPTVEAVSQLSVALDRPVVGVGWRVDDPLDSLVAGMERVRQATALLAAPEAAVATVPGAVSGEVSGAVSGALTVDGTGRHEIPEPDPDSRPMDDIDALVREAMAQPRADGPADADPATASPAVPRQPSDGEPRLSQSAKPTSPGPVTDGVPGQRAAEPALDEPESPYWEPPARIEPSFEEPSPEPEGEPDPPAPDPPAPEATTEEIPRVEESPYDDTAAWREVTDLHWQGQLEDAEIAYRMIIADRTQALGAAHPETLAARDQHATVLRDLDRLDEAQLECEDVLAARTYALGGDHPDTLTSRSHLATIYHQLGDLAQAEVEHRRVLEARTRVLGPTHQETLISRSNLAKVHQDLGELDLAIDEHSDVLDARINLLGAEHRDPLMSRSLLASALHQAGRLNEAEQQHRRVLASRLRVLGPMHLDTAVSRHRLASVLHDLGRLDEAIEQYHLAHDIYADLLGSGSPFARAAASDLAMAERAAGR
jgi:tetratricopeptide (TPR) repeat protein